MVDWSTVQIPKELLDEVEKFLKTKEAKKKGITSKSQFITRAIDSVLDELSQKRFEHINFEDNCIRLIDNHKPQGTPFVEIRLKGKDLRCDTCQKTECIHISAVWQNQDIADKLLIKGLRPQNRP